MELFGTCLALGLLLFAGIGALLGWMAYVRLGKLERRVAEFERAQSAARAREAQGASPHGVLEAWRSAAPGAAQPAAVAPLSAPPPSAAPPAPVARATPPAPVASATTAPEPPPVKPARPIPEPAAPEPAHGAATSAPGATAAPRATGATTAPTPTPARPASKPFDLERWLGVRGAAVLGGVFLAIAGFLFLQHSIERGWITPLARVVAAAIGGVACFACSFPLRRRGYAITASALAGAGAVILYAASWAASMLYGFVSPLVAFAAMGAVTAACVLVAWRYGTVLVAVLGLVGGFATPLVLSTGQDRPFGLFGYILLLDLAFLCLAGRRRWPGIGIVALVGTTLIQALWVARKMDPDEAWIGLGVVGLFAVTFAAFASTRRSEDRKSWIPAQTGAVLLPFAFVVYFAQSLALAIPLGSLALLSALLCAAAGVLARRDETPWLPVGAAAGSTALLFTWSVARPVEFGAGTAWLVAGCALGLAALQHALAEWRRPDGQPTPGSAVGAATSAIGVLLLAIHSALDAGSAHPWPWIACFALVALLLQRQAVLAGTPGLAWVGTVGAGMGLALQRFAALGTLRFERDVAILATLAALGLLLLAAAHRRRGDARAGAFAAVAGYFAPAVFAASSGDLISPRFAPAYALSVSAALVLAIGGLAAASGARSGACFLLAALTTYAAQAAHVADADAIAASAQWVSLVGMLAATTVLFAVWPLATRAHWRHSALAWCTAALQPLAWVFPVAALVEARYASTFDFATPLVFAAGTGLLARATWRSEDDPEEGARRVRRRARIAATMAALLLASCVVPVQVDREPAALTLAIYAAALSVLWTRVDSLVVKWTAVLAAVAALAELSVLSQPWSFEVPPRPVANVHAWLYLVPAACAGFAASRFRTRELERLRGAELGLVGSRQALAAGITGLVAVVLVFVWINVEIAARFTLGDRVAPHLPHAPGRALATSLGWAIYALVLLALGVRRRSSGPRWASLILFLGTSAKVFLFDLGHLEGLQRAASMLGLALSLIAVSLVYQRFVFRRAPAAAPDPDPAPGSPPVA